MYNFFKAFFGRKKLLKEPFLNSKVSKKVTLIDRIDLSHDSAKLRFALDAENRILGLPVGKHFKLNFPNLQGVKEGEWNGREDKEAKLKVLKRSYTPTSGDELPGVVDLVVKFYRPNDRFCDGGKVSRQLDSFKVGDTMEIQGPFGRIEYLGKGKFKLGRNVVHKPKVSMMAGGSGITPMYQILTNALKDKEDSTEFKLIYANQKETDILLRPELEALQAENPSRFSLHYTLDFPDDGWSYSKGFITHEMIAENLFEAGAETLNLMCGPPPMIKFACRANLDKLGHEKDCQIEF
eukprot:augustus_masked-scaffold_3-processed-gene-21.90-mRNA-1 protein AED:0.05 eAED:0.05 QI:0/-1/0/1/-1/1/1/0/293